MLTQITAHMNAETSMVDDHDPSDPKSIGRFIVIALVAQMLRATGAEVTEVPTSIMRSNGRSPYAAARPSSSRRDAWPALDALSGATFAEPMQYVDERRKSSGDPVRVEN